LCIFAIPVNIKSGIIRFKTVAVGFIHFNNMGFYRLHIKFAFSGRLITGINTSDDCKKHQEFHDDDVGFKRLKNY
jgi:hypothetical protein